MNFPRFSHILKKMRSFLFIAVFAIAPLANSADPPAKRGGGFFGFGARTESQISAALFPGEPLPSELSRRATEPARAGEGIFRGGQPQKVEPVSYVIENGIRVERPVPAGRRADVPAPAEVQPLSAPVSTTVAVPVDTASVGDAVPKKRSGFFGFGKRDDPSAIPEVSPLPPATAVLAATPVKPSQGPAVPNAPPALAKPTPATTPPAAAVIAAQPLVVETKEERGSWIPFLNRRKPEPVPVSPPVAAPIPAATPLPDSPAVASSRKPAVKPSAAPAPKPAANQPSATEKISENPEVATFEIRRDESKPVDAKKDERDGGLLPALPSLPKIRPPKKEIDLSNAETIIDNGEIVGGEEPSFAATPATPASGPRQDPQIVNGVKTYSSWDDVEARSSSAADKILNRIR